MKVKIYSDLHFESNMDFDIPKSDAELVVLAGDINEGVKGIDWAQEQSKKLCIPIIYVFGNHEFHLHRFPRLISQAKIKNLDSNVIVLERNSFVFSGYRFIGCTLWTDFNIYGEAIKKDSIEFSRFNVPDYKIISKQNGSLLQPEDTIWIFDQSVNWLKRELSKPWSGKTVVITHHAPSMLSSHPEFRHDLLTAAFISNLDLLIQTFPINVWIHGHTHFNVNFKLAHTRIITNQLGNPGEQLPAFLFQLMKLSAYDFPLFFFTHLEDLLMAQAPHQSQQNLPHPVINRPYTAKDIPSANFGPLGLLGFGMTTILLNIHNAGFYPVSAIIISMGIFYGGLAQIIAGILGSRKGNTFAATAFISYGFFWLSLVGIFVFPNMGISKSPAGFMGWYLFLWGLFSFFMFIGTLKANRALQVVFFLLFILFFLLALHNWTGSAFIGRIAGWEGILCGASAFYLAIAEILNEQFGRDLLPI